MRRAVITGIGAISSLGTSLDEISRSLREGRSGIGIDPERKQRGFRSCLSGLIKGFDPAARFDRKTRKTMGEAAAYGCAAALDAIADAAIAAHELARPEVGAIFGNDTTCQASEALFSELHDVRRTTALGSSHIIKVMNSTVTMNLATLLGFQGACWSISAAAPVVFTRWGRLQCSLPPARKSWSFAEERKRLHGKAWPHSMLWARSPRTRRVPRARRAPSIANAMDWCLPAEARRWWSSQWTQLALEAPASTRRFSVMPLAAMETT